MATEKKLYTLADVAVHNNANDCWLVIDGQAYDVTRFLEEHPGGDEVLLSATGMLGSMNLKARGLVGCYCRALFFSTF
jgi:hypothetical protein